jgi:hypothetical protein
MPKLRSKGASKKGYVSDEQAETSSQPPMQGNNLSTRVENQTLAQTGPDASDRITAASKAPGGNSRVLRLASIVQYTASRRTAAAQKRLANELAIEGQCSRFPM